MELVHDYLDLIDYPGVCPFSFGNKWRPVYAFVGSCALWPSFTAVIPVSAAGLVSSPGEFHPEALSEPYVNVSAHTAPIIQPRKANQVAN